jgi:1,4-dihydroxy-2-naphthoate octaprenyltransferase
MKRIKPTFWLRTITAVPYLSRDEWESLDLLSKWLIAVRARFLVMTFVSCLIGGLLAFKIGKFHLSSWLLCTVGFLLAHAAGNILNDLIDYVLGVDKGDYLRLYDEPHPLAHNLMSLKEHLLWTSLTAALSFLPWIYLVHLYGSFALLLFLIEVFLLLFYTYPLKYIGLGELAIFIIWGPLMVGGCYFASAGEWSWRVVLASIPHALGVTAVLLGDHLDKYEFDKKKGIRTLPVILGERKARMLTKLTILFQYLTLLYLIATRFFSPVMLLVLFTLPSFLKVLKLLESPMPMQKPEESLDFGVDNWPRWFRAGIFWHNRKFGIAFIIALIIDVMLVRYRGCLII